MDERKDIMVTARTARIPIDSDGEYPAHLLCLGGKCRYRCNGRDFELRAGDLSIVRKRKMIERIEPSDDFRCKIIYVRSGFVELCTPRSNYGMKGRPALFLNSVMHLSPEQQIVCRRDFELPELRIRDTAHRFYRESLIDAMQAAMLDFFDFHARIHARSDISRLLRDKSLSFVQISDMFGFSSPSYFSRYVQQNLGLNPTDYRK